jgi:hypothetical protein
MRLRQSPPYAIYAHRGYGLFLRNAALCIQTLRDSAADNSFRSFLRPSEKVERGRTIIHGVVRLKNCPTLHLTISKKRLSF